MPVIRQLPNKQQTRLTILSNLASQTITALGHAHRINDQPTPIAFPAQQHHTAPLPLLKPKRTSAVEVLLR